MNPSALVRFGITALFATGFTAEIFAQSVVTDPVGFVTVSCTNNSDTYVSIPFHRASAFVGALSGTASVSGDSATLSFSGSTGWTTNQFQNTHYVRFKSGGKLGSYYTVSANSASTLTIALNGDSVSSAAANDSVELIPYWTLDTVFPVATQTTITASAGNLGFQRKTQILFPDRSSAGTDLAAGAIYFLNASNGWTNANGFASAGSTIVPPDSYFIVRQPSTSATTFTAIGSVEMKQLVTPLASLSTGGQDNPVALARPVPVALKDSGLSTGFVPSAGNLGFQRKDQLLILDNTTQGTDKAAAAIYFMVGTSWYDANGFANADNVQIQPGTAFIVRKAATVAGATAFWQNTPTY